MSICPLETLIFFLTHKENKNLKNFLYIKKSI
uniref:Uncharacterized protein n=1 Tax=Myoviridae sp. ctoIO8 TaxID=2825173 RepID=A0A8S5P1P9_9CAUD|nr:MAG TPA: hypothetical protein [Myoviridae sp. ctoIO8]